MNSFRLQEIPEMEVQYEIIPGDIVYSDDIEIQRVLINGKEISIFLEEHLVMYYNINHEIYKELGL